MSHSRLGELLINEAFVSRAELDFALALQSVSAKRDRLGAILIDQGLIGRERLARILAKQAGWDYFNGPYIADQQSVDLVGLTFYKEHFVFPLKSENGRSFVFTNGDDTRATDILMTVFGRDIAFYIGVDIEVKQAVLLLGHQFTVTGGKALTDIKDLLYEASVRGATDVHIEPAEATVNIRFRVDGVLHFFQAYPRSELSRIVNMAFNRAGISSGDFLRFHDARFEEENGGRKQDIRLSHLPSANGSSLVLRILDKSRSAVSLSELGYSSEHRRVLVEAVKRPHGLIIFTGPTGCGKTTSLYSLLSGLKGLGVKVVTAEDPVEIRLPLVTQVPVDMRREQDFHHITRSILRHDPDVILVGEIRDEKTAREAIRAAITGHRVLATLHTNGVMGAILRLHDLGIDYPQIGHALTCIATQRLVRKLCSECKEELVQPQGYRQKDQGCPKCLGGYTGRTVVAEIMCLDENMRFLIEQGQLQEVSVKYKSSARGLTMREDAERLLREGVVSRSEIERVLG